MIVESSFKPAWWMRNPHLQTILPRFYRKPHKIDTIDETFELSDGDFVEICWTEKPSRKISHKPIVIVFHGLAGSINSFYAAGMMKAIKKAGWIGVLMHFRGCGKHTNRHPKAYHSGATDDAREFIQWLAQSYPNRPMAAIGFSLGGNMLAKYLGESGDSSFLDAAVVISAPLKLSPCAKRMSRNFSRVYQKYLLDMMKTSMIKKLDHLKDQFPLNLNPSDIKNIKTLREFDDLITGPLHGFVDAEDYYAKCSGLQFLRKVTCPTLIIHAADDPFMTHHVHPQAHELSESIRYEISRKGGHVGFLQGKHPLKPQFWLEQRVPDFILERFNQLKDQT